MPVPVQVDIITPLPEGWGLCTTCEAIFAQVDMDQSPQECAMESFPPEWQEEYARLTDLILSLVQKYGDAVVIRLVDPRSLQGLAKSIRFGVRKYPTFVVEGRNKVVGMDGGLVDIAIRAAQNLGMQP